MRNAIFRQDFDLHKHSGENPEAPPPAATADHAGNDSDAGDEGHDNDAGSASAEATRFAPVTAVLRAMHILDAFALSESALSLAELGRRCGLHKSTVLRLARTLAVDGWLVQRDDGLWRLGPAAGWLGTRYQAGFDAKNAIEPTLRALSQAVGESAAFYVREGTMRSCLIRVEGPRPVREHARAGERLPLDSGSPGRVILAFTGEAGEPYEQIRQRGYHWSIGERVDGVATVSAPVFGLRWRLVGSLCVTGPASRLDGKKLQSFAPQVMAAARQLSYELSGKFSTTELPQSRWHP